MIYKLAKIVGMIVKAWRLGYREGYEWKPSNARGGTK